ncbi:hypothetical protein SAMN02745220_03759 [Desulfopila aestuarii DSM 18488]|uniref:Uncharacterized protein n=1 Tax=Desulfopila aestuarii DSM 18488 TaxID=1121416 RepID=A0A1M7YEE2_9BACT|nr:hypothetical protein SAMN02745220_03759 [Desulfopila aestuarii DSM 18488]
MVAIPIIGKMTESRFPNHTATQGVVQNAYEENRVSGPFVLLTVPFFANI